MRGSYVPGSWGLLKRSLLWWQMCPFSILVTLATWFLSYNHTIRIRKGMNGKRCWQWLEGRSQSTLDDVGKNLKTFDQKKNKNKKVKSRESSRNQAKTNNTTFKYFLWCVCYTFLLFKPDKWKLCAACHECKKNVFIVLLLYVYIWGKESRTYWDSWESL